MATTGNKKPRRTTSRRKPAANTSANAKPDIHAEELASMKREVGSGYAVQATPESVAPVGVVLQKSAVEPTSDQALWVAIRNRTEAIGFENYAALSIERSATRLTTATVMTRWK